MFANDNRAVLIRHEGDWLRIAGILLPSVAVTVCVPAFLPLRVHALRHWPE